MKLCSELSAERGLPLIGSAGCYDSILAFELDPPWSARLAGSRACDAALDAAIDAVARAPRKIRLLAIEPEGGRESRRLLWFDSTDPAAPAFSRREFVVARAGLAAAIGTLAAGGEPGGEVPCAEGLRDILVCTHGARDACCGKFGFPVYARLRELATRRAAGSPPVRIWRTSHLGGHRFAPTLVELPSGRIFGRVATGDAEALLDGGEALRERLPRIYRGRCALPEAAQIVERELWIDAGGAFEAASLSFEVENGQESCSVSMTMLDAAGRRHSIRAEVARADEAAVVTPASCGRDAEREAPWKILS